MAKIYFADGMDCELALQDGASVGDALATAAARLDVKKPHARFLALHAASATGAVEAAPLGRATALANGGRLVILVRLWTPGLRQSCEDDAVLRDLAFRQARCCALADTWPCPVRDGARAAAAQLLRDDARVSRIAGWGSSAGAAALLFCMAKYDAALACCVLDGSYADVRQVAACVEINQCVGCTTAASSPSGEEPASPSHRAGAAAWRTTR